MLLFDSLEAFKHMIIIKLDFFSRKWKLYLMEMLMIKTEETKWLDLVVYSEYSGELTDSYLPYSKTSMTRMPMACLQLLIRARFFKANQTSTLRLAPVSSD